ncbi:MAG: hypothetical protein J7497_02435 [Chitinophagaceae bacterium]|nr:hypothetical protein [Chitinophagaceae bacterium]
MPAWQLAEYPDKSSNLKKRKSGDRKYPFIRTVRDLLGCISGCTEVVLPLANQSLNVLVDLDIKNIPGTFNELRDCLRDNGLYLVKTHKNMRVIVIKDEYHYRAMIFKNSSGE